MQIILKIGKSKPFWYGNPIVFSGAIERINGNPQAGDLVEVFDHQNKLIGYGVFNPYSSYHVRILARANEITGKFELENILRQRIAAAAKIRSLLNLPDPRTNAYRLFNSEGDGLSGLTIDVFNQQAVVSSSAYWVEKYRTLITKVVQDFFSKFTLSWIQVKKVLVQDGWQDLAAPDQVSPTNAEPSPLIIHENELQYGLSLTYGQKTGHYCDQRDNRLLVRGLSAGRRVLDLCCYSGGFALNAALGGALQVVGVDSSPAAIELAEANAKLNQLDAKINFTATDLSAYLRNLDPGSFDFIILDPPKIAASHRQLQRAMRHYIQLNELALSKLTSPSLLLTFTCSGAIKLDLFLEILRQAAYNAGKNIKVLQTLHASPDHPVSINYLEGDYLQGVLLAVN